MARAKIIYGRKNRYFADDREVTKAEFDRIFPSRFHDLIHSNGSVPDGHRSGCWPMVSDSCAIHPTQAQEIFEKARKSGVPTEFRVDKGSGLVQPVFTSQAHRREYARKVEGMLDRNACYGDPTPG